MKTEYFKKIEGYENYSISNLGRVRNDKTGRFLKPVLRNNGYYFVSLSNGHGRSNGCNVKQLTVHRLVAMTFMDNPDNLPCVNHKDENKQNNELTNLEWCDHQYNNTYGTKQKRIANSISKKNGCVVDNIYFNTISEAARYFNFPGVSLHGKLLRGQTTYKGHSISYAP